MLSRTERVMLVLAPTLGVLIGIMAAMADECQMGSRDHWWCGSAEISTMYVEPKPAEPAKPMCGPRAAAVGVCR